MSIASEITRINNNIASAYSQCQSKGATMPATQNSANLANTISTISGGGGADLNDYFNTTYENADWVKNMIKRIPQLTIPSGTTSISFQNILAKNLAFDGLDCTGITAGNYFLATNSSTYSVLETVDLANITNANNITNFRYMFYNQYNLKEVKNMFALSGTKDIRNIFASCQNLTSIDLSNWNVETGTYGSSAMFQNTYKLAVIDISGITFTNNSNTNTFQNCGRDCLQSDGAYADGIPYVYVKDATAQAKVLASGNVPASWTTNNVVIKS